MLTPQHSSVEDMTLVTEHDPLVLRATSSSLSSDGTKGFMSVQEVLDTAPFSVADVLYLLTLGIIAISDSMQSCYLAIVLPKLTCEWDLNASQQALVTSLNLVGTGLGGVLIGPFSDRYGRKPAAMVTSTVLFLTMMATAATMNVFYLVGVSAVAGACTGGSLSIAYTYWAEVSNQASRAVGVLVITMFWNSGILVSYGAALLSLNEMGWRSYTCLMGLPAILPVMLLVFLHESPKYLNEVNKRDQLMAALRYKLEMSKSTLNLGEIDIHKEPNSHTNNLSGRWDILKSFRTIFSEEFRYDTLRILASYSCLQIQFKGMLYVVTAIFAQNMCAAGDEELAEASVLVYGQHIASCKALDNGDLESGMLLSLSFYVSTVLTVLMTKRFGEHLTLKSLGLLCLVVAFLMLFCLPGPLFLINLALNALSVAGISLVFYIILPQVYPTVARNSGFGLIDGCGKLVSSVAIFGLTTTLNFSIRAAIGLLVGVVLLFNIQVHTLHLDRLDKEDSAADVPTGHQE